MQAASQIEAALNAAGAYADWLKKTVGALQPTNREVLDAIAALQVPIATCNYDGIIEGCTRKSPASPGATTAWSQVSAR